MKVVLDTNVLVSAVLTPHGKPSQILALVLGGEIQLCVDERIVSEYREVLLRKEFSFPPEEVEILVDFITKTSLHVIPRPLVNSLPDPDDAPLLEVAVAGRAVALVTGNKRHFSKRVAPDVPILSPAEFLSLWGRSS